MAAIAAEVAPDIATLEEFDGLAHADAPRDEPPEIEVRQERAGRETLAVIAHEMLSDVSTQLPGLDSEPPPREHRHTVAYEERPPLAPETRIERKRMTTLDYTERPATTKRSPHAVGLDVARPPSPRAEEVAGQVKPAPATEPDFEIHEMVTFVVKGDLAQLSSTTARRDFVRERVMHRLPVHNINEVDRIDVTPWTVRGTVIVRVWCRI